jgi:hypothetical protein
MPCAISPVGHLDVAGERGAAEGAQIDGRDAVRRHADGRSDAAGCLKFNDVALAIGE